MTAGHGPEIREETLLYLLPRVYSRREEIRAAIETHRDDRSDVHTLGRRLAWRLPELEAIAAALGTGPEAVDRCGAEAGLSPEEVAETRSLAAMVSHSPALSDAIQAAYPGLAVPDTPPLLAVLVGDPLLDEQGLPIRPNGQPRWRIPWTEIERELREVVKRAAREVEVEVHPATWTRALEIVPRARYLAILCHGSPDALFFEERLGARVRRVGVNGDVPLLFAQGRTQDRWSGGLPEIVLVLACHGAPAARAIAEAGVALAVGISEQEPLHWPDAVALSGAFFAAFLNGSEGELAFRQAVETTHFAQKFEIFHGRQAQPWVPPVPRGEPEFPALPRQEESPRPGFVGRERELARLLEAMERPGLAVIRGAPGQGKTELAQALLERCRLAGFPAAGSLFIDLEVARTPAQIVEAAAALTPGQGGKALPSPERAGRALGSEERLAVLDNAENACESKEGREALRELIDGILAAGKARVVVTTRTKLGWPGPKTEIRLEPLATDAEAVALLHGVVRECLGTEVEARWRQILRSEELAELVGQLGRHPLSLRLAAVLLADGRSPREVLRDLRETGSLDETTDADDRLGSLRASLELSRVRLDAVAPGAAELWRIIAEFPAGIPEATQLHGDDRRHLRVLLERHLLERRRGGIECLPPVRFFLRCHVEDPREERRTRIAAACGAALKKQIPPLADRFDQARVEDQIAFARWLPTIDVLLRGPAPPGPWRFLLLASGASIASRIGLVPLAWCWCEAASWSDSPDVPEAAAHHQAGILAGHLGRLEDAHAHLTTALEVFQDHGERSWEASTQKELGQLAELRGQHEDARAAYRTALKIYRNLGNRLGEAQAHQFLGRLALVQERLDEVATHFDYALRLYDELGARLDRANLHKDLGDLNQRANRLSEARTQYDVALASFREIGHRLGEGETQRQLGNLTRKEDRLDDARGHYEAALGIFREIGYPFGEADTRGSLGNLALDENHPRDARPHFEAALRVYRDLGHRSGEIWALHGLALAALGEKEPQRSLELAQQAADLALLIRHHLGAAASLSVAARSHLALDEAKNAVARLLGARYHARQAANRLEESKALRLLAGALLHADPSDPEQEAFAREVGLAGAVLAKRAADPLPPELAQAVDELEASGQADAVLDRVGRTLDDLTEENLPEPLRRSIP